MTKRTAMVRGVLSIGMAVLITGFLSGNIIRYLGIGGFSTVQIGFLRGLFGALFLLVVTLHGHGCKTFRYISQDWKRLLLTGLLWTGNFYFAIEAFRYTSLGLVMLIVSLPPIWLRFWDFLKLKVTRQKQRRDRREDWTTQISLLAVFFVGMAAYPYIGSRVSAKGVMMAFGNSWLFAIYLRQSAFLSQIPARVQGFVQNSVVAISFGLVAVFVSPKSWGRHISLSDWQAFAVLGIVCTGIFLLLFSKGILDFTRHNPKSERVKKEASLRASLLSLLSPLFGFASDLFIWGETLSLYTIIGGSLALLFIFSVLWADYLDAASFHRKGRNTERKEIIAKN